jgi:hypothetical protein
MQGTGMTTWESDADINICAGTWTGTITSLEGIQRIRGFDSPVLTGGGAGTIVEVRGSSQVELRDLVFEAGATCAGAIRLGELVSCSGDTAELNATTGSLALDGVSITAVGSNDSTLGGVVLMGGSFELVDSTIHQAEPNAILAYDSAISCVDSDVTSYPDAGVQVYGTDWSFDSSGCTWGDDVLVYEGKTLWDGDGDVFCDASGCQ